MSSSHDVWVADLQAKTEPRARAFAATAYNEFSAAFAPDGRAIAFTSNESGDGNIYVRRFPEGDRKVRVSIEGEQGAQWSRDGNELFYQSSDGKLMGVSVRKNPGLSFGEPHVLFEGPYLSSIDIGPSYAVSPDGRRFLMARQSNICPVRASELIVIQNWFEDVRRLAAAAK